MANDIGQKEKQRDSIKQWAEKMESSVSEHMNKPPKFRKDALESEIRKIESYSEAVIEKQHSLVEFAPDDSELQNTLETLSSKINILKDLRIEQSIAIENFRQLQVYLNRSIFLNTVVFCILLIPTLFIERIYLAIGQ